MTTSNRPALLGGQPLRPQGPPDWPLPDESVRLALEAAFRDGSWGKYHGGHVARLERRLAEWCGCAHALTCGSGTFAVELGLRALQVQAGDEVALAAYDYGGNFLTIHALGARPVLVDVEPGSWQLSVDSLRATLVPSIKAVIASHLHGGLVRMREVRALCDEHGVGLIEDAAQAPGATVQGRPVGTWGDLGIFSFGGSKLLSASRGGALVTNRADVHQRARLVLGRGSNLVCPLSEMQAAVLLPQLEALPQRHRQRADAVAYLRRQAAPLFEQGAEGDPAFYKVGLRYDPTCGLPRSRLTAAVRAEGIALDEGFRALHAGRAGSRWRAAGPLDQATRAGNEAMILHHPVLLGTDADLHQVIAALQRVHEHAAALAQV